MASRAEGSDSSTKHSRLPLHHRSRTIESERSSAVEVYAEARSGSSSRVNSQATAGLMEPRLNMLDHVKDRTLLSILKTLKPKYRDFAVEAASTAIAAIVQENTQIDPATMVKILANPEMAKALIDNSIASFKP
ncbi:uncharacterized protein LOC127258571 [Andrographis paniculata]|uniref:uncharacterized protein LOC127258571 n=1 Tax=Andrographis paniculata TaxID=175694 RepID=UPI0021E78991|nr:uncharacterized protein LOC127258571 [Andrographis paniculata]